MSDGLIETHGQIFTALYLGTIVAAAALEAFWPRRAVPGPMGLRWLGNGAINLIDIAVVRLVFPVLIVGVAVWTNDRGLGLFAGVSLEPVSALIIGVLLLDLGRYMLHFLLHRVPLLWRLHRVHHTDQEYDFSTGLRFHPLEAVFTTGFDMLIVILLGLPAVAVAVFSLIHAFWSIFAHSNIRLPLRLDRVMRLVFVTPDLHRTHHSAGRGESMTNFGGFTPWWDRLFGTYKDQPDRGHRDMTIGLSGFDSAEELRLGRMLMLPFRE